MIEPSGEVTVEHASSEEDQSALEEFRNPDGTTEESVNERDRTIATPGNSRVPVSSREAILDAMRIFDENDRAGDAWRDWEDNVHYKWALVHDGRRYPVKEMIRRAAGTTTASFSGGEESNRYLRSLGFTVHRIRDLPPQQVWWVNQGATYVQERELGVIWAPKKGKTGSTFAHWSNLSKVQSGDIILHYANSKLRAVSRARDAYQNAPRPSSLPGELWESEGYLVHTDYTEFSSPIPLADIPPHLRQGQKGGPFTQQGNVNQGYLYPAPDGILPFLVHRFDVGWPDDIAEEIDPPRHGGSAISDYESSSLAKITEHIRSTGLRLSDRTLRRYHLSLISRGFVILAGISGTGKTWLAEAYASAVGAEHQIVAVAPNWNTNEDLLGYFNPVTERYHDTSFSEFIRQAADAHRLATQHSVKAQPYHLILDEMNLARVEYYFAGFLSAMEVRARHGLANIDIGGGDRLELTPNLYVVGTVNIDETTHGFADKVWDRAQLVELDLPREGLVAHLGDTPYRADLLTIWDIVRRVGPFAYRVVDDIATYVTAAEGVDIPWEEALDEQILQKILPKLKGTNPNIGLALQHLVEVLAERYPLSHERASQMLEGFNHYGFTSYFA